MIVNRTIHTTSTKCQYNPAISTVSARARLGADPAPEHGQQGEDDADGDEQPPGEDPREDSAVEPQVHLRLGSRERGITLTYKHMNIVSYVQQRRMPSEREARRWCEGQT